MKLGLLLKYIHGMDIYIGKEIVTMATRSATTFSRHVPVLHLESGRQHRVRTSTGQEYRSVTSCDRNELSYYYPGLR